MRLLYKAVAAGAVGAAGITALAGAAQAAPASPVHPQDTRSLPALPDPIRLLAAPETSFPGYPAHSSSTASNVHRHHSASSQSPAACGGGMPHTTATHDGYGGGSSDGGHGAGSSNGGYGAGTNVPASGVMSASELPVTGPSSSLMTTIGFAFIIGGAGVLYLTRLGGRDDEPGQTRVPSPRNRRPAPGSGRTAEGVAPRRPRPSPQAARRGR